MNHRRPGKSGAIVVAWALAMMAGGLTWGMSDRPIHTQAATESASSPAVAASPSPTPPSLPPGIPPPGVRQPLVGGLGVLAIVVAAAAGFFIYRQIRRGL